MNKNNNNLEGQKSPEKMNSPKGQFFKKQDESLHVSWRGVQYVDFPKKLISDQLEEQKCIRKGKVDVYKYLRKRMRHTILFPDDSKEEVIEKPRNRLASKRESVRKDFDAMGNNEVSRLSCPKDLGIPFPKIQSSSTFNWESAATHSESEHVTPNISIDVSSIVHKAAAKTMMICGQLIPVIPEIDDLPPAIVLIDRFVSEDILEIPSILKVEDAAYFKQLYTKCIKEDRIVHKHIKKNFQTLLGRNDAYEALNRGTRLSNVSKVSILSTQEDQDHFFKTSLKSQCSDIIEELSTELWEFETFYRPIFEARFGVILSNPEYVCPNLEPVKLKEYAKTLNENLINNNRFVAGNHMDKVMISFDTANRNKSLRMSLMHNLSVWFISFLKTLVIERVTSRTNGCCAMAFLFTRLNFIREIIDHGHIEVFKSITLILFLAIEKYPDSFEMLFATMGYVISGCHQIMLLITIVERGNKCTNPLMRSKWPLLIYYALKHWPKGVFASGGKNFFQRMKDSLENVYHQNRISRKSVSLALLELSKRFNIYNIVKTANLANYTTNVRDISQ